MTFRKRIAALAATGLVAAGGGAAFAASHGDSTAPAKKPAKSTLQHAKKAQHTGQHQCPFSGGGTANTALDL